MAPISTSPSPHKVQDPVIANSGRLPYPHAHILVVDDEPMIAQSISDLLSMTGEYRISLAAGGHDALKKVEASLYEPQDAIDLVLLDIDMPLVNGLDVLKWIRQNPRLRWMRVIMLTGISDKRDMVDALSEGADDYITKPYHPQELLARIGTTLRTQQLEKQLAQQSRQLAMLNTISNTITKKLEIKDLLEASVEGVRELLNVEVTAVFMQDGSRQALRCQHVKTLQEVRVQSGSFKTIPLGRGVISLAYTGRATHCVNEAPNDHRFDPEFDAPRHFFVESIMAAPIYMRGHPIGVLVAMNKSRSSFAESDADLFVSLAGTMSQAIENAWLFSNVRHRQQELLESRNSLQAIIDGILQPIYTINNQWQIVSINATRTEDTDENARELIGRVCYEAFYGRTAPCEHCEVAKLFHDREPHNWSVRWVGSDYLPREWDVNAFPLPSTKDESSSVVIVWQDRTEERRLENSLHQAAKLSAVGQLAAGVAHEINNPLTVIKTGAEMLKDVVSPDAGDDYELVEWIENATERAIKVVRGLLDFARQSRYEFEYGSLDISINDAIDLVSYQMRKRSIEIVKDLSPEIPELVASWEHLKTVWINLLINARDALENREEDGRIEIRTRIASSGDHLQVVFRDNGSGMPEEQMAHIFVPFFTTKDPGKGTGLGLATCHRIIDRHGGEITVTSKLGEGTAFIIRLPLSETPHSADDNAAEATRHS